MDIKKSTISLYNEETNQVVSSLLNEKNIDFQSFVRVFKNEKKLKKGENVYAGSSLDQTVNLMRKNKSQIGIFVNKSNSLIRVAVKHQRRYKYLTHAEITALYLNYYISKLKRSNIKLDNYYVVCSSLTYSLIKDIAANNGVEVINYDDDISNIPLEYNKKTFLFATNELGYILTRENQTTNILNLIPEIIEMSEYYMETQKIDLYTKIANFKDEYGLHRYKMTVTNYPIEKAERLVSRMKNVSKIGDFEVSNVEKNTKEHFTKLTTTGKNMLGVRIVANDTIVVSECFGTKEQQMIDVISFEKDVSNVVSDNYETFELKKFSWKTVFKYVIFTLISAGIFAFIFTLIYEEAAGYSIWEQTKIIFNHEHRIVWIFAWWNQIFGVALGTWKRYRMMKFQKARLRFHEMMIGNIMGAVISFITPFTIGGDAIVYWYLRRKGVERGPLIASLMSTTVIHQVAIVIQTLVLFPFGYQIYFNIFKMLTTEDPIQGSAVLMMFIIGLCWNLFATFMILTLVMYRRFQEFIVKYSIIFLEWFRFTNLYDPGSRAAKVQYEFREMRRGSKMLWSSPLFLFENFIYLLLPFFFKPHTLLFMFTTDFYRNDMSYLEIYFSSMVTDDIVRTSNSLSLTPGGAGTGEWLSKMVNPYLLNPTYGHEVIPNLPTTGVMSSIDLIFKMTNGWPWLLMSTFVIITVIYGESSLEHVSEINKHNKLTGINKTVKSKYYWIANPIWAVCLLTFFLCLFFVPI